MALVILTLAEMKLHSSLAEVQAFTEPTLGVLEAEALDLLEVELGRKLTVDSTDVVRYVSTNGSAILSLPERLDSVTSVTSDTQGALTSVVERRADGWLLGGLYPNSVKFTHGIAITGKWGITCPDRIRRVLMDVVEALAIRKGDPVSRRDELTPWGSVTDGGMSASRDNRDVRKETLENLLRYDVKSRLRGYYSPNIVETI